jgi:hypothetical protein
VSLCSPREPVDHNSLETIVHNKLFLVQPPQGSFTTEFTKKFLSLVNSDMASPLLMKPPDWTFEEVEALLKGIRQYGADWKCILEDPAISGAFHFSRTESSLKSKWAKIMRFPGFDIETVDIHQAAIQFSTNFQRFSTANSATSISSKKVATAPPAKKEFKKEENASETRTSSKKVSGTKRKSSDGTPKSSPKPSPSLTSSKPPQKPIEKSSRKKRKTLSFDQVESVLKHRFVEVRLFSFASKFDVGFQDELELLLKWKASEDSEDSWHSLKEVSGSTGQLLALYYNSSGLDLAEICKVSMAAQKAQS